ncbi:MAG TPA: dipeptide epimerase, partial [Oscillospiraceae bacterium]|nr:dipeptide epimerase [Oscillospiraceae bacterium]
MRIAKIQVAALALPLSRPFKTALRTVDSLCDVAVRVTADTGETGYGEAPPTAVITGETTASIRSAVLDYIKPALLGRDPEDLEDVMARLRSCMVHNTSAKAAVDMALYDLVCKHRGVPLYRFLGGARERFETDITISVNPVPEMVADSLDAVRRGFRCLKIKVGKEGLGDVARVAAVRKAVGGNVTLRVDANQGYSAAEAVAVISRMEADGLDIELVEQPVPAEDFDGLLAVTRAVKTPVLADESVFSPADARRILDAHAADLINIKLMKTGGIHEALRICDLAERAGVTCMIGCMLESKLSVSAAVHLAAARAVITRADLDG